MKLITWLLGTKHIEPQPAPEPPKLVTPESLGLVRASPPPSPLLIECYEDPDQPGSYRVDLSMDLLDEDPMIAIFLGPHSRMRANSYAEWLRKNSADYAECIGK